MQIIARKMLRRLAQISLPSEDATAEADGERARSDRPSRSSATVTEGARTQAARCPVGTSATGKVISISRLRDLWEAGHADAEQPLKAWFAEADKADWATTQDIKARHAHASVVDAERVVFNIGGNKYRLVVKIWFRGRTVWVKFVGTHAEYNALDVHSL